MPFAINHDARHLIQLAAVTFSLKSLPHPLHGRSYSSS